MLTAKVYSAIKSDVEYTQDKAIRYIKAKGMILEYLNSENSITNEKIRVLLLQIYINESRVILKERTFIIWNCLIL